jgi:hypothetical protein
MTLDKIRSALSKLATALGLNQNLLARAQRRYRANRKRAYRAHAQQVAAQKSADLFRKEATKYSTFGPHENQAKMEEYLRKAARKDKKAERLGHVAYKNHARAQHFIGVIKTLNARLDTEHNREAELKADLKALNHVTIKGNHATGGSDRERLKKVALKSAQNCASGKRNNFYSQSGEFDAEHCITGPAYGHRDDCSSWFASVYFSAGLDDPSGEDFHAGYTGTLVANGKQVSSPKPGDAVIYGPGAGHHVEMFVGPGEKTIGHGSAPVDEGTINLFGDGDYRFFRYV